ncbi:MAG TPA: DoxX family protein [Gemmatimonadaceae bacterium]|nr:DoxX family protein [Gemmatimonadaceae bacterium]
MIRVGVALIFVSIGLGKFDSRPGSEWVLIFARIGLGQWFRVFTGVVEVLGGVLMAPPRTSRYGALLLAATMLGAAIAHVTVLRDPLAVIIPLVLGGIAVVVGLHEPSYDIRALMSRGERERSATRNSGDAEA